MDRVDIRLSARDLAVCVAEMTSHDQATFVAELARQFAEFSGPAGPIGQMHMIGSELGKTDGGIAGADLLKTVLESAEESFVKNVMDS